MLTLVKSTVAGMSFLVGAAIAATTGPLSEGAAAATGPIATQAGPQSAALPPSDAAAGGRWRNSAEGGF